MPDMIAHLPGDSEYDQGWTSGWNNEGVWGGESEEWLRGYCDGADALMEHIVANNQEPPHA